MIPFNRPAVVGTELDYIAHAISQGNKLSGDGFFTKQCQHWLETNLSVPKALLTPSCTAALEMCALLINIQPGDEVIMPSYTFVSTANPFVLCGARIVFVDIDPNTMNLNAALIDDAITPKTKAIVVVHYAGVACDMDAVLAVARCAGLYVIEDAAQALMSRYKDSYCGTIGDLGCFSFHDTKNYTAGGEGGALVINDKALIERAEIIREKGTNRSQFLRGQIDKYTWYDIGSSYLPSELQAAYLLAQLEAAQQINNRRHYIWNRYHDAFLSFENEGLIERPYIPDCCIHNAHMYFLKMNSLHERSLFIEEMNKRAIQTVFHYVPLHSSTAGLKYCTFHGKDIYTTKESDKLVRLPLWFNMTENELKKVINESIEVLGLMRESR